MEEDAAQLSRPLKKGWIFELGAPVLVGGQNVHSAETQAFADRGRNVMVQIEAKRQGSRPTALSLARTGDSPAAALDCSTERICSSICSSSSC